MKTDVVPFASLAFSLIGSVAMAQQSPASRPAPAAPLSPAPMAMQTTKAEPAVELKLAMRKLWKDHIT